jgi:polyene glycosyltransferase
MTATQGRPILFCATHSTGEANTSLAIAGELARRGVANLWFAGDENHRAAVAALTADSAVSFASMGPVNPRLALTMVDEDTYRAVMRPAQAKAIRARTRQLFDPEHHFDRYCRLDALVDQLKPALMVINRFCTYAIQVALTRNIPYVVTAPCLPSDLLGHALPAGYPCPSSGLPRNMTASQRLANRLFRLRKGAVFLDPVILRRGLRYAARSKELGIDSRASRPATWIEAAETVLCFSVFGLDYPFPIPEQVRLLGAMIPQLPRLAKDDETLRWLDSHQSVTYIAFGSVTRMTRADVVAMVDVIRRLGDQHHVLWVLPQEAHCYLPGPDKLPDNLRVESWMQSQYDVLAHRNVRVFFTHGGSNSFHEGVYFGKPLLVRPICIDQSDHAVRAVDSGVGLAVDRTDGIDADDVHRKLVRLLAEDGFRQRAEHFGRLQQASGGLNTAVDLIRTLAGAPAAVGQ